LAAKHCEHDGGILKLLRGDREDISIDQRKVGGTLA
jgi:hypothetical protein